MQTRNWIVHTHAGAMKRSCRGVPKLVEQFFQALGNGKVGPLQVKKVCGQTHIYYSICIIQILNSISTAVLTTSSPWTLSILFHFLRGELWQGSMKRLRELTTALLDMPHYLVPHLDFCSPQKHFNFCYLYFGLVVPKAAMVSTLFLVTCKPTHWGKTFWIWQLWWNLLVDGDLNVYSANGWRNKAGGCVCLPFLSLP